MFFPTPKLFIIYTDVWAAATVTLRYRLATYTDVVIVCWLPTTWWWYPWRITYRIILPSEFPIQGSGCAQVGYRDSVRKVWNIQMHGNKKSHTHTHTHTHTQVLRTIIETVFHRVGRIHILSDESCKKRRCLFFIWCLSHTNIWWG